MYNNLHAYAQRKGKGGKDDQPGDNGQEPSAESEFVSNISS